MQLCLVKRAGTMNPRPDCLIGKYLEAEDIPQALEYAAWRSEEIELPLARP